MKGMYTVLFYKFFVPPWGLGSGSWPKSGPNPSRKAIGKGTAPRVPECPECPEGSGASTHLFCRYMFIKLLVGSISPKFRPLRLSDAELSPNMFLLSISFFLVISTLEVKQKQMDFKFVSYVNNCP